MATRPDPAISGQALATPAVQEMQRDSFANPAMFWLDRGQALFARRSGTAAKSCADCHGSRGLDGVATAFPKVVDGDLRNLEAQINACRTLRMGASALPLESEELLSLTVAVREQSSGQPVAVAVDGPAAPHFQQGRALYTERRGQMNLACFQCHDERVGLWLRGEQLTQGQTNGMPGYLLRWGAVGSVHRRLQFCDDQRLAEPRALGSDAYLALELYTAWRGNGLPVEALAVRR
ncbi:MAG: sulfur oxidation c-type cytochrome SoxA [Minwuia sp.]|nr:sulfur oxidation c-type cytochrome SoxA [Minwuia sp.]